jgi:hypothetical protein
MALTKKTVFDKIETTNHGDYLSILAREKNTIFEDDVEISSSFKRTIYNPDADISTITDPVVLAQFNAVMTSEVKANYQTFLEAQNTPGEQDAETNPE